MILDDRKLVQYEIKKRQTFPFGIVWRASYVIFRSHHIDEAVLHKKFLVGREEIHLRDFVHIRDGD